MRVSGSLPSGRVRLAVVIYCDLGAVASVSAGIGVRDGDVDYDIHRLLLYFPYSTSMFVYVLSDIPPFYDRSPLPVLLLRQHALLARVHADLVLLSRAPQVRADGREVDGARAAEQRRDRLAGRARAHVRRVAACCVLCDVVRADSGTYPRPRPRTAPVACCGYPPVPRVVCADGPLWAVCCSTTRTRAGRIKMR